MSIDLADRWAERLTEAELDEAILINREAYDAELAKDEPDQAVIDELEFEYDELEARYAPHRPAERWDRCLGGWLMIASAAIVAMVIAYALDVRLSP